jgi:uncharacterized repeat protein (TIGR01451 family)
MSETGSITGSKVIGPVTFTVTVTPQWVSGPQPNLNTSVRGRFPAVLVSNNSAGETRGSTNHVVIATSEPVTNLAISVGFFGTTATERMANFTVVPTVTGEGFLDSSNVVVPTVGDGTVTLTWSSVVQRIEFDWTSPGGGASLVGTNVAYSASVCDMGDAPASYGSAHATGAVPQLVLGASFTADLTDLFSPDATGDIDDALALPLQSVPGNPGATYALTVPVRNSTPNTAVLQGWIDLDRSGTFDPTEMTSVTVPPGGTSGALSWTTGLTVAGPSFVRLRLHQDPAGLVAPTGPSAGGEVEDYAVTINAVTELSIVKSSTAVTMPQVGQPIPYQFLITNTGNVTMTGIAVTDPTTTGVSCPATTLAPGVATTCTGTHTVTQSDIDAGAVTNTATVVGTPPLGPAIPPVPSNQVTILATQLPALSIVKSSTTVTIPPVGQTIPYQFLVTNTGNVTMTGVAVSDPNTTGVSCPVTTLAPAASMTCTGSHTVVQADVDAAAVTNAASVVGTTPGGTPIPPVPSNQVTINGIQNPALSIVKSSTMTQLPLVGDTLPYSFLVTNIGDVTVTGIAVTDANTTGVSCPATTLAPGNSTTCTATHTVVQADINTGTVVNSATVTGMPPSGTPMPPVLSNQITIPGTQNPALALVKASPTTVILAVGDVVPYTFTVTNVGNVTMTAVAITDNNTSGISCPATTLAPGAATTCTGTHTVTQADIDSGAVINTAAVVGTPPSGPPVPPVPSNEITIAVAQTESLSILKTSTTTTLPAVGATIPYEFLVANTGNVTMTAIAVTDPNTSGISCPATTLAPGSATTCTGTHTVTQADRNSGAVINTAVVVGTPPDGTPIPPMPSNEVTITGTQNPVLSIVKSSTTTSIVAAGQTVPYTFTVTNTGDTTITGIAVTDPKIADVTCPQTTLDPGNSTPCTASYTVTAADLDHGQFVNTATVTGTPPSGPPVPPAPSNTVTIPVAQSPSLSIVKSTTTTQATAAGQNIPFTFLVTNTGNVTMSNIVVTDPNVATVNCPQTALAAAGSMTCTATYTTTAADLGAGQVINTATVVGTPSGGPPITPVVSNQVLVPIAPTPGAPATTATTTTIPPTTTNSGQIPATGGSITPTPRIVFTLTLLGTALLVISRRRKRTPS